MVPEYETAATQEQRESGDQALGHPSLEDILYYFPDWERSDGEKVKEGFEKVLNLCRTSSNEIDEEVFWEQIEDIRDKYPFLRSPHPIKGYLNDIVLMRLAEDDPNKTLPDKYKELPNRQKVSGQKKRGSG